MDKKALTAPCGLDCFNCELYEENLTEKLKKIIQKKLGVPLDEVRCQGCRVQDGKHFHLPGEGCANLDCAKEKEIDFCCDCVEFPCALLAPTADGAKNYPHNFKVYNLCRIKQFGIEQWIEESAEIRKRYFNCSFVVGKGQAAEDGVEK